jgi:branched-chain amino acid transport system permease protein
MPSGLFHSSYIKDEQIFQTLWIKVWLAVLLLLLLVLPLTLGPYPTYILNIIGIYIIGAVGLNILTGFTGQISIGHAAFMGVGAYAAANISTVLGWGFWIALPLSGLVTAAVGMVFGIPSLRLRGLYLAIATLAAQFIIEFTFMHVRSLTGGSQGFLVTTPHLGSFTFDNDRRFYYIILVLVVISITFARNLFRTRTGRAFVAIRDRYLAAEIMGVNLFKYRLLAFGISSFYAGVAGCLWAHYITIITPEHFNIMVSIKYLSMVIIGGLGSVLGTIFGTIFMVVLPEFLRYLSDLIKETYPAFMMVFQALREGVFGLVIIFFLIFEPDGMAARWQTIRSYWKLWPFSY